MKSSIFACLVLVLMVAQMQMYLFFRHYFSGTDQIKQQNESLYGQVRQLTLERDLALAELTDFQQHVATLIPEAIKKDGQEQEKGYQLRTLASVIVPAEPLQLETSNSLFEKGKAFFRDNKFEDSNRQFEKLIQLHPLSVHAIEAKFLLMEGRYQLKEYENALEVIDNMISLFPEHVLTGFAMLRMGQILELQDRIEDATEIYKTVVNAFNDKLLNEQAQKSIKEISL